MGVACPGLEFSKVGSYDKGLLKLSGPFLASGMSAAKATETLVSRAPDSFGKESGNFSRVSVCWCRNIDTTI